MKMFKCSVSLLPGRFAASRFIILAFLLLANLLPAQDDPVILPFSQANRYRLAFQLEEITPPLLVPDEQITFEKKSPSRAFFSSLILPGTGEAYVGEDFQSKLFLGLELVGWGLVIANVINVNMRESDYQNYALMHATVSGNAKDDQYWIDIGKYDSIYEYNEQRRRERDLGAIYPETRLNSWQWDANANRLNYDAYRIETREVENSRLYFFAAIALNHLLSAVNALRLANAHNRNLEEHPLQMNFNYNPYQQQFTFSFHKTF